MLKKYRQKTQKKQVKSSNEIFVYLRPVNALHFTNIIKIDLLKIFWKLRI